MTLDAPNREKLPKALQVLPWRLMADEPEDRLWGDCDRLLVAVPVRDNRHSKEAGWSYEISVVVIRCDEDFFAVELPGGESWGWDFGDIEWFVPLDEAAAEEEAGQ